MKIHLKEIKNKEYLAKGKRSIVYTGYYKNKKVAIKTKNPKSKAVGKLENEAQFLKILNKHNIGPKLMSHNNRHLIYEFVDGTLLPDYIKKSKNPKRALKNVLNQCRTLDKLKINKLEFTRPIKHIFIKNNKATIIDFERCYITDNPKNVTQFCQYLMKENLMKKDIQKLKEYKKNQTDKNFKEILKLI